MAHKDENFGPGWTCITVGAAITGEFSAQNKGGYDLQLQAHTSDSTAPTSTGGAKLLRPGWNIDGTLEQHFRGVSSAAHLWVYSVASGSISVTYA